jgi:hypothetical protein
LIEYILWDKVRPPIPTTTTQYGFTIWIDFSARFARNDIKEPRHESSFLISDGSAIGGHAKPRELAIRLRILYDWSQMA